MLKSYDQSLVEKAFLYGLPKNLAWTDVPSDDRSFKNNMLYACLIGDYEMNFAFPKSTQYSDLEELANDMEERMYEFCHTYPDLAGWYMNSQVKGNFHHEIKYNKYGHPVIRVYLPDVKPETIMNEREEVMKAAEEYRDKLYDTGVLKETMTEMEKVQAYYKALDNFADGPESEENYRGYYDTSYGFFIKKECFCGGRASGVSQLMHLEGIKCAGVCCTEHITTMLRLEGKDYIIDIGNRVPLKTLEEALAYKAYGEFEIETIENAQRALGAR